MTRTRRDSELNGGEGAEQTQTQTQTKIVAGAGTGTALIGSEKAPTRIASITTITTTTTGDIATEENVDFTSKSEQQNLFFEDSLSTLAALLEEDPDIQNALPQDEVNEINDLIEATNLDFQSPLNESNEVEVPVITSVSISSPSPTPLVYTELGPVPLESQAPIVDFHIIHELEAQSLSQSQSQSESSSDGTISSIAISKEDLELTFTRSCKIVLTRCCTPRGGKPSWRLKDKSKPENNIMVKEAKPEAQFSDFIQGILDDKRETAEEFVASLLKLPEGRSAQNYSVNNDSTTDNLNSINYKSSQDIDIDIRGGGVQLVKGSKRKSLLQAKMRMEEEETERSYLMEQNKLIRIVPGGFECVACGKKFESRWNLIVHVRIHTGERPYQCPYCSSGFRQLAHVQKHARKVHQQEVRRADVEIKRDRNSLLPIPPKIMGRSRKKSSYNDTTSSSDEEEIRSRQNVKSPLPTPIPTPTYQAIQASTEPFQIQPPSPNPSYYEEVSIPEESPHPQRKGFIRLIHPNTEATVEVQEDLLMHFLKPFLNDIVLPEEGDMESKEVQLDETNLIEIQSKLKQALNVDKEPDRRQKEEDFRRRRIVPKVIKRRSLPQHHNSQVNVERRKEVKLKVLVDGADQGPMNKVRSYRCKTCDAKFPCIAHLRMHMRTHVKSMDEFPVKCKECTEAFQNDEQLMRHMRVMHSPDRVFESSKSSSPNSQSQNLHRDKSVINPSNSKSPSSEAIIKSPNGKRKRSSPLKDLESNGETGNEDALKNENGAKKAKKRFGLFKCGRCNNYFANVYNLQRHKLKSCPYKFQKKQSAPKTKIKSEVVLPLPLPRPPSPVQSITNIPVKVEPQVMLITVSQQNGYHNIENQGKIKVEVKSEGEGDDGAPPPKSKTKINSHRNKCNICGESFNRKPELKEHMRLSHGKKVLTQKNLNKCPCCELTFVKKNDRLLHVVTVHPTQTLYECETCFKKFVTDQEVVDHRKTAHTEEQRPLFGCQICGKKFVRQQSLKTHESKHNGIKPFKCQKCDKSFTRSDLLSSHVKKIHAEELENNAKIEVV